MTVARPFLKWAGGKGQLLKELTARMPPSFTGAYFEPFLGGGALFFATQRKPALLSDLNLRLVRTYRAVRDDVEGVIEGLQAYATEHAKDASRCYYAQRAEAPDDFDDVSVAAWMIYLNKTGFNGLYRVNKKGQYNNPVGRLSNRAKTPVICDAENLRACAAALAGVEIEHLDYNDIGPIAGDFVYLDPPYVPASKTSNFTTYTADGFNLDDQAELADVAARWRAEGVHVLLSNSAEAEDLYRNRGFSIDVVAARRAINGKATARGPVSELLAY